MRKPSPIQISIEPKNLKVLHTIPSLGVNSGGPPMSTTLAVQGIRGQGIDTDILSYNISSPADRNISEEEHIHFLQPPIENKMAYSNRFGKFLDETDYDLYHCQGVWQHPSYITAKKARTFGKPYVITPRGMLYPQQLKPTEIHKKLAMAFYQKNDLQKAACIHATCKEEMQHLRVLGVTSPIAVIPNPIETQGFLDQPVPTPNKQRFGYLGRVHPRKNIERILYAWEQLSDHVKDSELVIIGDGDRDYLEFLKKETERLNLSNVLFTGFLSGDEKEEALASLSYLVVPSDFENFGMIIAEALVRGIPVIASKGTPWEDLETHDCGWWVENDVETLKRLMKKAGHMPEEKRIDMGWKGKKLIQNNYTVESVGNMLSKLYEWIMGRETKPPFVYTI